jgi:hypothetical protein
MRFAAYSTTVTNAHCDGTIIYNYNHPVEKEEIKYGSLSVGKKGNERKM